MHGKPPTKCLPRNQWSLEKTEYLTILSCTVSSLPYAFCYYICRLSVVLKASAYTLYNRYLTKCVDSLKPPADGE